MNANNFSRGCSHKGLLMSERSREEERNLSTGNISSKILAWASTCYGSLELNSALDFVPTRDTCTKLYYFCTSHLMAKGFSRVVQTRALLNLHMYRQMWVEEEQSSEDSHKHGSTTVHPLQLFDPFPSRISICDQLSLLQDDV